jgi:hypothetical protein
MQQETTVSRAAYSPSEFAAAFGRHQSWAYRLLYAGKVKAVTDFGRVLIPASEMRRLVESADRYNPHPDRSHQAKANGEHATEKGGVR